MLYYGTMDNNVHPTNMMQLISALQKAGKSFDVQVGPDQGHSGLNGQRDRLVGRRGGTYALPGLHAGDAFVTTVASGRHGGAARADRAADRDCSDATTLEIRLQVGRCKSSRSNKALHSKPVAPV